MDYRGITYFSVLDSRFVQWIWKMLFCRREWHLFDEVLGVEHYLYCDACGLVVGISKFEEEDE